MGQSGIVPMDVGVPPRMGMTVGMGFERHPKMLYYNILGVHQGRKARDAAISGEVADQRQSAEQAGE